MKDIFKKLGAVGSEYAPIPFWSWNNRLEKDKLLAQIRDMKAAGMGGFIIHARTGLTTEYLSEEWFALVEACLDEAKALGMNAWIYDENGWPSGFVGGRLLEEEENLAPYLVKEERTEFDETAFAVFEKTGAGLRRLQKGEVSGDGIYHTVYVRRSPANTDILEPKVVDKFLALTHEEYYRRFSERFGKELVGFFTDEPQYFRWATPFSYAVAELWKKEYGEDIADRIIDLFYDDESTYPFRVRYYTAMNTLYTENYYKRLYDWCSAHGCKLTGHSVEESRLFMQMWGCAGCTPSYEYEHIPGIDNLARNGSAKLSARQVGSATGQLGKKQVLTETFGCSGYDVSPRELKAIAEKQYVHGVNLLCHHLYAYSLAGQGKTDHPPCFSPHMTWRKQFPEFNTYFTRLGWLLANSETCVNCAVINPLSSVYLKYNRFDEAAAARVDEAFDKLQETLNRYGILYDLVDERLLRGYGCVQEKSLKVGKRAYDFVVVPECENLSAFTKEVLEAFVENGGKIMAAGVPLYTDGKADEWEFLHSDTTFEEIASKGKIRLETDGGAEYTYRKGDGFEFLYIVNVEKEPARVVVPAGYSRVDLLSLKAYEQEREIVLGGGESILLMPVSGEKGISYGAEKELTSEFRFAGATDNNLTLDMVQISFDGVAYGEEEPLAEVFDRLLRAQYEGKLYVKYSFTVKGRGKKLALRREKGKYLSSSLNGRALDFTESAYDFMFEEADISATVREGTNEYINELNFYERPHVFWALYAPEATESVRNCLWYDTELENIYLRGDFSVNGERALMPPAAPERMDNLQKNGFPNFAGKVKFSAAVFGEKKRAKLKVEGDYTAVEVFVNGREAGSCLFGKEIEIELKEGGENALEIAAVSSLRNMFGPLHLKGDEDEGVGPFSFTMRGAWKEGKCEYYAPDYRIRPFGVSAVKIAFEK